MPTSPGLKQRISRALLLQAGAIAVAAIVGVYVAGVLLKDVLIARALLDEAEYFWAKHAQDPGFPLPDTRNLTAYLAQDNRAPSPALPVPELIGLDAGFHTLPESRNFGTVYVSDSDGKRLYLVFDGEQVDALAAYFGLVPLAIVLLVLYLSVWVIYRASQRAVSPITRLARTVNNLDPEAPDATLFDPPRSLTEADQEVRVLYAALARFAERLNAFVERERNFTRDASHELRSPLTVIGLAADMLASRNDLSVAGQQSVARIKTAAREMEELVKAFLLLARESDGKLASEEVCINAIVDTELERARELAGQKPIEVAHNADCVLYTVGSEKVLSVLIGNLIRNAFQYTDTGRVTTHVRRGEVIIEDSGVGMEPQQVETLFEPFRRANPAGKDGYGVGLTIVKRLSDRFAWPVNIDSYPGSGTRVIVQFPEARSEARVV